MTDKESKDNPTNPPAGGGGTKNSDFAKLLEKDTIEIPSVGDTIKGKILSASKAEVRLDIDGILTGVVRGQELYDEAEEYSNLKPGDEIEATVVEEENENGELELSFRFVGHEKAWASLREAFGNKTTVKVRIISANRGGLIVGFGQINGFLPVSQLSPEKYPRVSGGDKTKILEKLKSYTGEEIDVMVVTLDESEKEEKIIFSEKNVWNEKQKDIIIKYKKGVVVEGMITAIANFGIFISFDDNLEGLIHISELAWQRIDDPGDLFKVGDKIKAEVISVEGSKIFLSAKKLMKDPWEDVEKKFKIGTKTKGMILKVNPFGLFIKLDDDIHGLAHVSQLGLKPNEKIYDIYKIGQQVEFTIVSVEPKNHRLGLAVKVDKKTIENPSTGSGQGKKEETGIKKETAKKKEKSSSPTESTGSEDKKATDDKKVSVDKKDKKKEDKKEDVKKEIKKTQEKKEKVKK